MLKKIICITSIAILASLHAATVSAQDTAAEGTEEEAAEELPPLTEEEIEARALEAYDAILKAAVNDPDDKTIVSVTNVLGRAFARLPEQFIDNYKLNILRQAFSMAADRENSVSDIISDVANNVIREYEESEYYEMVGDFEENTNVNEYENLDAMSKGQIGSSPNSISETLAFDENWVLNGRDYTETPAQRTFGGPCPRPYIYCYGYYCAPLPACQVEHEYKEPVTVVESNEIKGYSRVTPKDEAITTHREVAKTVYGKKFKDIKGVDYGSTGGSTTNNAMRFYETRIWGIGPRTRYEHGANDWQFRRSYICDVVNDHSTWDWLTTTQYPIKSLVDTDLQQMEYETIVSHLTGGWQSKFGGVNIQESMFGTGDEYLTRMFLSEEDEREFNVDPRMEGMIDEDETRAWKFNTSPNLSRCKEERLQNAIEGNQVMVTDSNDCVGGWGNLSPVNGYVANTGHILPGMALTAWRAYSIVKRQSSYHYVKKHNRDLYSQGIQFQLILPYNHGDNFFKIGARRDQWTSKYSEGSNRTLEQLANGSRIQYTTDPRDAKDKNFAAIYWKDTYCCTSTACQLWPNNTQWRALRKWKTHVNNWR